MNRRAYDAFGKVRNTHTYPSGLIVQNGYTSYGQLNTLSNKTKSAVYWTATAANEWDHVTGETFTGGTTGAHQDYHSTGQAYRLQWSGTAADKFTYGYDAFGNLTSQQRTASLSNNTESYTYDAVQRLTKATRSSGGNAVNYAYSKSGNLNYKDDYSSNTGTSTPAYSYGTSVGSTLGACGPHGATSVALPGSLTATYTCDQNGNVISGNTITAASYDAENHPRTMTRAFLGSGAGNNIFCNGFDNGINTCPNPGGGGSATWAYDANGQRDYESSALQGNRFYGPGGYELANGVAKHELGPVVVSRTGSVDSVTVLLKDRLGSTLATVDGASVNRRAYDAFGKVRNGDMSDRANGTLNLTPDTIHGFTNHTHEDDVALIHMGGRVYDYSLGRFLNVDPVIGNPLSSQSLNPYSYIGNNPLSGTDPTGYDSCIVSDGNSCTQSQSDTRSADPLGHTTYNMGSDKNVRAYSSQGGASVVVDNSGGGNGAVGLGSQGAGGIKNAQAGALDQMSLSNTPNNNGIPANVVKQCQGYSLPASCTGGSNDKAIEHSAADRVATGGPLDPNFRNSDVAAETSTSKEGVKTSLKFSGDVDDSTVGHAARNWNGDSMEITPARQPEGDGLRILRRSSRELAADLCLATCTNGYYIGGRTPPGANTIYINNDRTISVQSTSLTHELGHYFFGNGHPQNPGDFLKGGIMDYRNKVVNDADRAHYKSIYQSTPPGSVP